MNVRNVLAAAAVGFLGTASIGTSLYFLAEYEKAHIANLELARYTQRGCTPSRVGEAVALIIDQGRLACARFDQGIPKNIWLEYMHQRGKQL